MLVEPKPSLHHCWLAMEQVSQGNNPPQGVLRLPRLFRTVADTDRDSFSQRPFIGHVAQSNQFHPESTQSACWTLEHRPQAPLDDTFDLGPART